MANSSVISEIRKKNALGTYDIYQISPQLKYSKALLTSNNNNLEEQLLMGVDKIIRSWYDETAGVQRQIIEFRRSSDTNNYYFLDVYKYNNGSNDNIYIINDIIYFTENMTVTGTTLEEINYDSHLIYNPINKELAILPTLTSEKDYLYFKDAGGSETLVSSKEITMNFDITGTVITTEKITNHLS